MTLGGVAPPGPGSATGGAGEGDARAGRAMVASRSHVGPRRRVNEDAVAIAEGEGLGTARAVAVVCDGIAGGAGGDRAASVAARAALAALTQEWGGPADAGLQRAVAAAHRAVCEAHIDPVDGKEAPGTTLIAAVAHGTALDVAWVGDSRAYLVPPSGPAELLTHDHSWVNMVVDRGDLSEAEARASRWAQVITRCVGPAEDPDPLRPPQASLCSVAATPGSCVVLCTDGLWGAFDSPGSLAAAARAAPEPSDAAVVAGWLVARALAAGAEDDTTAAVILL